MLNLGNGTGYLLSILEGKSKKLIEIFLSRSFGLCQINFKSLNYKPFFLLGSSILNRKDSNNLILGFKKFSQVYKRCILSQ